MSFDFRLRTNRLLKRLKYFGVWFGKEIKFDLYFLYAVCLNISYNLHNVAEIASLLNNYDSMSEWTASGLLIFSELLTNFKGYCVIKNRKQILRIYETVANLSFQPKNGRQKEFAEKIFKMFDVMYYTIWTGASLTVVFYALVPIVEYQTTRRRRPPFNTVYPYNSSGSPWFEITYIFQIILSAVQAFIHLHADCLAVNFMAILIVQLHFLGDNLRCLTKPRKSEMDAALVECIQHHKEILTCFGDLYAILSLLMFVQLVMSTTVLCLTSLEITDLSPTSTIFIALVAYEFTLVTELLLYCWWGNELTHKSEEIPQAAFECDWTGTSNGFKKSLIFFIFYTQDPMILKAVSFFSINLTTFVLIIKNSYSFYAVLRQMKQ